ncbi:MAG TPA: efflux RND transporter periplasmic adaptor subunit [Gemmatimonadaceae bacterium]|nr:efflux RND transporter periplasmic adaptor subunit [Gemmatimonadaceae bacterium]
MKKTRVTIAIAMLAAIGAGLWFYQRADASETPPYRFASVQRANVHSTVSATGTLSAVTTVQVGTQVSGQVAEIRADFNDEVKKGQLLARIDPTLQKQAVSDAQAGVERVKAQYEAARLDYERSKPLYDSQAITATEFNTSESNYLVSQADLKSAQIALDKAKQNLAYTNIYAPINGVVVERNVDVGQTVAASLQAPQLFLIANDLSQMQILASVDESDIGRITDGQKVTFTVQSYPEESFEGTVRQVRLQSAVTENVVNYTVVVGVSNRDGKLLPGMTATVTFHTASAADVLTVPNAALRFRPAGAAAEGAVQGGTPGANASFAQGRAGGTRRNAAAAANPDSTASNSSLRPDATLWRVDASGKLVAVPVHAGLTDGKKTEVQGAGLTDGMQVIVGSNAGGPDAAAAASTRNPLQAQQQGGRGRPPGMF